jgi:tetratricopeptide (TPR) repeat protein
LARQLGDRKAEAKSHWILLLANIYWGGNNDEAVENGEQSLAIARELNLREQMAYSLQDLSLAYLYRGDLNKARQCRLEAAQLWQEFHNQPMLVENIVGMAVLSYLQGEYKEALALGHKGYQISQEIGNLGGQGNSGITLALTYTQLGEFSEALQSLDAAVPLADRGGLEGNGMSVPGLHAWICACCGKEEQARALIHEAFGRASAQFPLQQLYLHSVWMRVELLPGRTGEAERIAREGKVKPDVEHFDRMFPGSARIPYLAAAELALAQGDYVLALQILTELFAHLEQRGISVDRALVLWHKGQALTGLNRQDEAREVWGAAQAEAEARQERPLLWRILMSLAEIARARGNTDEAARLGEQARGVVEYIAEHAPAQYRESFLYQAKVRQGMNGTSIPI